MIVMKELAKPIFSGVWLLGIFGFWGGGTGYVHMLVSRNFCYFSSVSFNLQVFAHCPLKKGKKLKVELFGADRL